MSRIAQMATAGMRQWTQPGQQRRLAYRLWLPEVTRWLLVVVHGFGEHGGRYGPFAQALAGQGIAVAVPDLWGHGLSDGLRGDTDVMDCVASLRELTETVLLDETGQKTYAVFGHSFGGLVAIQWGLQAPGPLSRLVAQSPLLEVAFHIPRWKYALAHFLADAWPTFVISTGLDPHALTHDPEVVRAYQRDRLVHRMMSARTYPALLRARDDAMARAGELRVPTLLLLGSADTIVSVEAAQAWVARVQCEKRCVAFPGCLHELHHESVREDIIRLVTDWVTHDAV